ncbi:MAG: hypothetical protein ACI9VR_004575 [Cognaticolwellia sp.]|jgi:hypothetical protein
MTALFLLLSCTLEPTPEPVVDRAAKAEHSGHWKRLDNLNFGHAGMVVAAMGDQVLIFGGFSPTAERLDLVAGKVLPIDPAPFPLQHATAVALSQGVLIQGGTLADQSLASQGLLWTPQGFEVVPGLTEPRSQASAVGIDGASLICGGQGPSGPLSSCEVTTAVATNAGPALPEPRSGGHMVALAGMPLLVGGEGPKSGEIWQLDGDTWREWATLSAPRWEHAVVVHGDQIWVLGGRDAQGALSSVEICTADGCEPGPTMTEARSGLSAGLVGGPQMAGQAGGGLRLVAFGGSAVPDSPDALSSRTVELLVPGESAWMLGERTGQARRGALLHDPGDGTLVVVGGENRGKLSTAVSRYSPLDKPPRTPEPLEPDLEEQLEPSEPPVPVNLPEELPSAP